MCGITGIVSLSGRPIDQLERKLKLMNEIISHRGPDDEGVWCAEDQIAGFGHRRLSIIDLTRSGAQPMHGPNGTIITSNGEVYNYLELRQQLSDRWSFRGTSDTETILAAFERYGTDCITHLRGMFSFAIWDEKNRKLFAARDRFGIKPFYYAQINDVLYFASEPKAILPFLPEIETEPAALAQYLTFQYSIDDLTLFKGIRQLMPGHHLTFESGKISIAQYWDMNYEIDRDNSPDYFHEQLRHRLDESVSLHLRSDVPVGAYLSGGIDSSLVSLLAARGGHQDRDFFHGKFTEFPGYDESEYAEVSAQSAGGQLHQIEITASDFQENIEKVIYHLDYPVAGPGSFPQYMVSGLASRHVKVVLGGQGGDEIFGGYARYLIAYLEQCIKAAMDGTYKNGNFVVTLESIIPNLGALQEYKPLLRHFWREGLFGDLHERYFRLIDRSNDISDEVDWTSMNKSQVYEQFRERFNENDELGKQAYFDKMTHFDFKHLLPALLHVEDRMSMAHGVESRVPLLDHRIVEFAATVPADIKFDGGRMKHLLKAAYCDMLPARVMSRRDKMGFPVPLKEWFEGDLKSFVFDIFSSQAAKNRSFMHSDKILAGLSGEARFSRKTWGLLSLELWHQLFHDKAHQWRAKLP